MKPKNLCLVAAIMALSMVTGLLTSSGTAHAQLPLVPHYECYDLMGPSPPGLLPTVTLHTQFGDQVVTLAGAPMRLCLPAMKNGEGTYVGVPHVECLPITGGTSPGKTVNLRTQFGVQKNVQVGPPIAMCMPAEKQVGGEPPTTQPGPVPHYECYQISGTAPSYPPVELVTQFGTHYPVLVGAPTRLCLPALKNGEGSLSAPHVECFQITGAPPNPYPPVGLLTQWGPQAGMTPLNPNELCVPAIKAVLATSIGGIAEAPDADASALEATDSGSSSTTTYAAIAGIAAVAVLLGAGGWYARRRWLS